MKFPKQIALATVVMAACIAGLVVLGKNGQEQLSPPSSKTDPIEVAPSPSQKEAQAFVPVSVDQQSARLLVPPNAWIVADFRGDLTGHMPFEDQTGECAKVPPPSRVAVAILPPQGGAQPELLLAAPSVEKAFWTCAVARIESAGGTALAENDEYQVFQSPTGIVARGPRGAMIFLSGRTHLETALSVLSEINPSAAVEGPHAALYSRMHPKGSEQSQMVFDATLALPSDWMASVGQDAEKSPLRHIHAAFLSASEDGSAQGGIDCDESGCDEVLNFLNRAQGDLVKGFAPDIADAIHKSLKAQHLKGAGRIAIDWSPSGLNWTKLLGRFLGP